MSEGTFNTNHMDYINYGNYEDLPPGARATLESMRQMQDRVRKESSSKPEDPLRALCPQRTEDLNTDPHDTGAGVLNTDPHDLLHAPMIQPNDGQAATVGEFLGLLLSTLWLQNEEFSGKRPLGNSDWQDQVYLSMIQGGFAEGVINRWGDVEVADVGAADELILLAIRYTYKHA